MCSRVYKISIDGYTVLIFHRSSRRQITFHLYDRPHQFISGYREEEYYQRGSAAAIWTVEATKMASLLMLAALAPDPPPAVV